MTPLMTLPACSSDPSSQATTDGGRDSAIVAVPAPDGVGVCCPVDGYSCSPHEVGGWAARVEECAPDPSAYDGCPFVKDIDAHGCPTLIEPAGGFCACPCGNPNCHAGGGHDAGHADDASTLPDSALEDANDGG